MKINEAAKALGVSAQTLRYYERIGLIGRVTRRSGGSRDFSDEELEEAKLITALRKGGVAIEDLLQMKSLSSLGNKSKAEEFVEAKIEECLNRADAARQAARILREEAQKWA